MGNCGSKCDISEMPLAGPGQTPEEQRDHGEKEKKKGGNPGEDRRNAPSAVTLAH